MLKGSSGLPWTIVRPSHTVRSMLPTIFNEGDAVGSPDARGKASDPRRRRRNNLDADTMRGFRRAVRQAVRRYRKRSARTFTSLRIMRTRGTTSTPRSPTVSGVKADIVHVPTDTLVRYNPEWEGPLMGDKTWSALFDNSKVKRVAGDFSCEQTWRASSPSPLRAFRRVFPRKGPRPTSLIRFSIGSHRNSESWERVAG